MVEIERKFIIEKPKFEIISRCECYSLSEIVQIYIESASGITHRIRKRTADGVSVYTETKKVRIDRMSAHEDEREISESEFLTLSENIKEGTRPINKKRYTLLYGGKLFEIDEYPEWEKSAILEIELASRDEAFDMPPFINVIEEVTGNRAYSNASMAKSFPVEASVIRNENV